MLTIFFKSHLLCNLPETLSAEVHSIPAYDAPSSSAPDASVPSPVFFLFLLYSHSTTSTLNSLVTNAIASSAVMRWFSGIFVFRSFLLFIR